MYILFQSELETPLGLFLVLADNQKIYLAEFSDRPGLEKKINRLKRKLSADIISGTSSPIDSLRHELSRYFAGESVDFKTPLHIWGTPFQQRVWNELKKVSKGQTCSYSDLAAAIDNPKGCRAVAQALGANSFAIILPCHRVISMDGSLGGYAGRVYRKKWLLSHEAQ